LEDAGVDISNIEDAGHFVFWMCNERWGYDSDDYDVEKALFPYCSHVG
jgi:hypothetical protein